MRLIKPETCNHETSCTSPIRIRAISRQPLTARLHEVTALDIRRPRDAAPMPVALQAR
ncbi:hypothetical protein ACFWN5_11355 [Streptomyces sp. NPDC058430]|uniref:hypothetical protein n=1 Tax=Streptomyces sp. NPDC058430 TaxID=3346495 RepID=UPI003660188B